MLFERYDSNEFSPTEFEELLGEYMREAYRRGRLDGLDEAEYLEGHPEVDDETGDIVPFVGPRDFNEEAIHKVAVELGHTIPC